MKKLTLISVALCALAVLRVSAQSCADFEIVPQFDPSVDAYADAYEELIVRLPFTNRPSQFYALATPPGLSFVPSPGQVSTGAAWQGEIETPGTYHFSVMAREVSTGCTDTLTFDRTYVSSPVHICDPLLLHSGYNFGEEHFVGSNISIPFLVLNGDDGPFRFYGIGMPDGAVMDSITGVHTFRPTTPNSYTFTAVVKDHFGCTDTYQESVTVMCNPTPDYYVTMNATQDVFTSQATPLSPAVYPPFSNFQGSGLPPGLTVSSSGVISGTPTQYGVFQSTISYNGLGGCAGRTGIEFRVNNPQGATQSLWVTPLCASSIYSRNWEIHNPNASDVLVNWEVLYNPGYNGAIVAHPGVNNFQIRDFVGWPWTIRIKWVDQFGIQRQIVQGSNDDTCTPVSCSQVMVTGVTFFHPGRRRDLQQVEPDKRRPEEVRYGPDANDLAFNDTDAVSLGFYGFITVKLSANLYDGPGKELKIWEHSEGNPDFGSYPERAEVFVSTDNSNWVSLGLTNPAGDCRAKLDWEFDLAGKVAFARYVKVVDKTYEWARKVDPVTCLPGTELAFADDADGFDLDAITCVNSVPPNDPPATARLASDETIAITGKAEGNYSVLSPNPATTMLTFDFSQEPDFLSPEDGRVEINIIDMSGRTVFGHMNVQGSGIATHNIELLSPGFFVARVRTTGFAKYYKFVKN